MSTARVHLENANVLLSAPSVDNLRFAALNLRMCMEIVTYEKLRSYSERIPTELQERWQPPQAVRALLEFEPQADQGFEIHVADNDVPDLNHTTAVNWLPLGVHKALAVRWLGKHYHKVGRMLHAKLKSQSDPEEMATDTAYLLSVSADLKEVLTSTISGSPFPVTTFNCTECGWLVAKNSDALRAGSLARCFNQQCGTEYAAQSLPDGSVSILPMLNYPPCSKCDSPMPVSPALARIGSKLICPKCKQLHRVVRWLYAPAES